MSPAFRIVWFGEDCCPRIQVSGVPRAVGSYTGAFRFIATLLGDAILARAAHALRCVLHRPVAANPAVPAFSARAGVAPHVWLSPARRLPAPAALIRLGNEPIRAALTKCGPSATGRRMHWSRSGLIPNLPNRHCLQWIISFWSRPRVTCRAGL
jgi:hypothetical protein